MNKALLFIVSLGIATQGSQNDDRVPLSKIDTVSSVASWTDQRFSIRDQIFNAGLQPTEHVIFELGASYSRLKAAVGIPDNWGGNQGSYRLFLDGKQSLSGSFSATKRLAWIDLNVSNVSTMRVELDRCVLADPVLYMTPAKPPASTQTVSLLEPESKAVIKGSKILLRWSAIENATVYGVDIVNTSLENEDEAADRMFSFTVKRKTSLEIESRRLAQGTYRWSVIAFNSRKNLGGFSQERSFTISR